MAPTRTEAQSSYFQTCTNGALSNCALLRLTSTPGAIPGESIFEIAIRNLGSTAYPSMPTSIYNLVFGTGGTAFAPGNEIAASVGPVAEGGATVSDGSLWDIFDTGDALFVSSTNNVGVGGCVAGSPQAGFGQAGQTCGNDDFIVFSYTTTAAYDPATFVLFNMEVVGLTPGLPGDFADSMVTVTPEPATLALLGSGLLAVFAFARRTTRRRMRTSIALGATFLSACSADRPARISAPESAAASVGPVSVTTPTFSWLAPLATTTATAASFNATAAPVVEVCVWTNDACDGPLVARFATPTVNSAAGRYEADWSLMSTSFMQRKTYRIRVLRGASELGAISVDVVRGRWGLTRDDGTLAPLASTTTLPIRFHIATETLRLWAASRNFRVGVAVGYTGTTFPGNAPYVATISREFNVLVPENILKWQTIRRKNAGDPEYRFQFMDEMLAFAEANGMQVRGHALAWHAGNPAWLTNLTPGTTSRDSAITLLSGHITTLATRWGGRIRDWDVANEVIRDGATGNVGAPTDRRPASESVWERLIGPDWVEIAFRAARAADPTGRLFYNDYSIEAPNSNKQNRVYFLVDDLLNKGVPITGVGFQSHFSLGSTPTEAQLIQSIDRFAARGLIVQLTELDITLSAAQQTAAGLAQQAAEYRRVVKVCEEHPSCDTVVVWGVDDTNSWRAANLPTLFTGTFQPKPAYYSVLDYLAGR